MRRLAPLDLFGNEVRNVRAHVLAAAPANPAAGQFYYNSGDGTLYYYNGTDWVAARSGSPTGAAGGDLAGTYPNPTVRDGAITSAKIADGTIVAGDVAAAHLDGTPATPSLRTLGTGPRQAAAGDDARILGALQRGNNLGDLADAAAARTSLGLGTAATRDVGTAAGTVAAGDDPRLSDARTPTDNSVTGAKIVDGTITDVEIATANKDGAAATPSMRTLGTGATQAAAGNDARLSNQRVPTDASVTGGPAGAGVKIAASTITHHNVAAANIDGTAATPSMRSLGTGATQAAAGNDARFTDARTPTGAAGGHLDGTYPAPTIRAGVVTDAHVAAANKDGAAATPSMRTLGTGATQAAAGNDPRLSDQRTPLDNSVTNAKVPAGAGISHEKIAAPVAPYGFGNQRLTSLADPVADTDAANKRYVDAARQGLDYKDSVRAATTGPVALTGTQTIDGVALVAGDRVLVKNQADATQNGVYVVAAGAWTRAVDADAAGEISPGTLTFVEGGASNGGQQWVVTAIGAATWTPGTTTSTWSQFSGASSTTAGAGLTAAGNVFAVGAGTGIVVSADAVAVDTTVVVRKFAAAIAGTGTSEVITHGLGTRDVRVTIYDTATGEQVETDVEHTSATTVTLRFGVAPGAGLRAVVFG